MNSKVAIVLGLGLLGTVGYAAKVRLASSAPEPETQTETASASGTTTGDAPGTACTADLGQALAAKDYATLAKAMASGQFDPNTAEIPEGFDFAKLFAEVPKGEADPLSVPMTDGIVWYGTWEAAMAEKERTGRPVMLHFGSPRAPSEQTVCVPGMW